MTLCVLPGFILGIFVVITFFTPLILACNIIICASLTVVLEVAVFLKIMACLSQRCIVNGREIDDLPDVDNMLFQGFCFKYVKCAMNNGGLLLFLKLNKELCQWSQRCRL